MVAKKKSTEGPVLLKLEKSIPVPNRSTKTEAAVLRATLDNLVPKMRKTQTETKGR